MWMTRAFSTFMTVLIFLFSLSMEDTPVEPTDWTHVDLAALIITMALALSTTITIFVWELPGFLQELTDKDK